jgi:hypothetical protein
MLLLFGGPLVVLEIPSFMRGNFLRLIEQESQDMGWFTSFAIHL